MIRSAVQGLWKPTERLKGRGCKRDLAPVAEDEIFCKHKFCSERGGPAYVPELRFVRGGILKSDDSFDQYGII